jgi:hypothetical protein
MMNNIVYDKLLSTWIILYSFGYIINIFKYNPVILLYIAYLFVVLSSIYILFNYNKNTQLFYFILVNSIVKLPFIFLIWNKKITTPDIIFTCVFIVIYVIIMTLINYDIICYYKDIVKKIINHEDDGIETPLFTIYKKYML